MHLVLPGDCITSVSLGDVCSLDAFAAECLDDRLSASNCTCVSGYEYKEFQCAGKLQYIQCCQVQVKKIQKIVCVCV